VDEIADDVRRYAERPRPGLTEALALLGISGRTASRALGVLPPRYSRWRHGYRPIPTRKRDALRRLVARALAATRSEIQHGNGVDRDALRTRVLVAELLLAQEAS
jgi:hypothetical protein